MSDVITCQTEEALPEEPTNVRILACTTTQLKIGWDPPSHANGVLKGYYIFNGKQVLKHRNVL